MITKYKLFENRESALDIILTLLDEDIEKFKDEYYFPDHIDVNSFCDEFSEQYYEDVNLNDLDYDSLINAILESISDDDLRAYFIDMGEIEIDDEDSDIDWKTFIRDPEQLILDLEVDVDYLKKFTLENNFNFVDEIMTHLKEHDYDFNLLNQKTFYMESYAKYILDFWNKKGPNDITPKEWFEENFPEESIKISKLLKINDFNL